MCKMDNVLSYNLTCKRYDNVIDILYFKNNKIKYIVYIMKFVRIKPVIILYYNITYILELITI